MEKGENRIKYTKDLKYFVDNFQLNDRFLKRVKNHNFFKCYEKPLQELKNDDKSNERKLFVLLEMTRERSTCAAVVKILRECGQKELADKLEKYNTSTGPNELSIEIEIPVAKGVAPILGRSNTYTLFKNPRGKCIIINNVEDPQEPDFFDDNGNYIFTPKGLKRETIRFENVFTQLHFKVEVLTKLDANQMVEQLTRISKESSLANEEAFTLIVISHGQDKKVLGYNACEAMRKIRFGDIKSDADMAEAEQEMERDSIKIKDVVKIFGDDMCPHLASKPKMFFFICCRNKDVKRSDPSKNGETFQDKQMDPEEIKDPVVQKDGRLARNLDTFVSYSCAQGFESNYNSMWGMSYFGVAFTQSIAQYAGDETLSGIMNRTSERLKVMFEDLKKREEQAIRDGKLTKSDLTIGSFAIEVNTYAMGRQLFFNPGFFEDKKIIEHSQN